MATGQNRVELKGSERAALPGGQDADRRIRTSRSRSACCCGEDRRRANSLPPRCWARNCRANENISPAKSLRRLHGAAAADLEKIRAFAAE